MHSMKALIVGAGGREHALARRLVQCESVSSVTVVPGNPGMARDRDVTIRPSEFTVDALRESVREEEPGLVVVGPAGPLVNGLADALRHDGITVVGPDAAVAAFGGSKTLAKAMMVRNGIPTPDYRACQDLDQALAAVNEFDPPMLVKADGLARGMGVSLCQSRESAEIAVDGALRQRRFGSAGERVIVERYVPGRVITITVLMDNSGWFAMPPVMDLTQVGEGGTGPNTLGMGAVVPHPDITPEILEELESVVVRPSILAVREMAGSGDYRGVLHCVIILSPEGPVALGYKIRFGDPELQAVLPLLEGDFGWLLFGLGQGRLAEAIPESRCTIRPGSSCAVVAVLSGYPGPFTAGSRIVDSGEGRANTGATGLFYHAVAERPGGDLVTDGGRVLSVAAAGATLTEARRHAYARILQVRFEGMTFRRDIGGPPIIQDVIEEELLFLPQFRKRGGVLPVVVQDVETGDVLMLAYTNEEALSITRESGLATFWSTSRQEIWVKGETSGDTLSVKEIRIDCDQDALLYRVHMNGAAVCHTRYESGHNRRRCFYRRLESDGSMIMDGDATS